MDKNTKEFNIGKIGKLILTKNIQSIIDKLHSEIGSTEWSGVLFYKITKGNIKDLKNLEITSDFLYPMNIGNPGYVEFDYSGELMNAYNILGDESIFMNTGLIHSHHNMSTFFSPTDTDELKSNCGNYNFYLSLIVNFDRNYCAKIAIPSKSKSQMKLSYLDENGKEISKTKVVSEDIVIIGNLDIELEGTICPDWVSGRISEMKKASKERAEKRLTYKSNFYQIPKHINSTDPDDLLGNNGSFDMSNSVKMDGRNYLSALINLDPTKINSPIYELINSLNDIDESDLEILSEAIDNNSDLIYEQLFPDDTTYDKIVPVTIDALEILIEMEDKLSENPVYQMLTQSLKEYARHYQQ